MTSTREVALLRGLNVGGKNRITMKDLAAVFEQAGAREVETYIQSGNVVFTAPAKVLAALPGKVHAALEKDFHITSPVVLRSGAELSKVARTNPFLARGAAPATLHVGFLTQAPPAAKVKALDKDRSPPDTFEVRGKELYLCTPNGLGKSKLSNAWFDAQLGVVSTLRNWNTVLALLELSQASP